LGNPRTNKLYNYLVNTYGLSKENIMSLVHERIEDVINKHVYSILNSDRIKKMIIYTVADFIKNGKSNHWHRKDSFESLVEDQIRKVIEDQLRDRCEIKFKFNNNSVLFIHKED